MHVISKIISFIIFFFIRCFQVQFSRCFVQNTFVVFTNLLLQQRLITALQARILAYKIFVRLTDWKTGTCTGIKRKQFVLQVCQQARFIYFCSLNITLNHQLYVSFINNIPIDLFYARMFSVQTFFSVKKMKQHTA